MSQELRELYQQMILDHYGRPRNFGALEDADGRAEGYNPLCGDRIHVELQVDDAGKITRVGFTGKGCAICTASASMMTEGLRGKTRDEAEALFQAFHALLTSGEDSGETGTVLGKLAVFAGVREFPIRVKCATLPWHTLRAALENRDRPVSTE